MNKRRILYSSTFYLSLFVIVLTSSFSIPEVTFFDQKKIAQTGLLLFGSLFFLIFIYQNEITGVSTSIKYGIIVFLGLLLISSIFAPMPQWAFLQTAWYVLLAELFVLNIYRYIDDPQRYTKFFLAGIIALSVLYCSRVYADYISGLLNEHWTIWPQQHKVQYFLRGEVLNPNAYLGFSHVRFFNHIQTWTLPLLSFAYLYFKDNIIPGLRYLLLFFISSWWMLVFAADARGTMLASGLSLLFILYLFKSDSFEFIKIYVFTAASGLVLYLVLFLLPNDGAREILSRFGDSGRLEVWQFAIQQIIAHPFLGLGPMHFSYMGIHPPWSTPHNFILQSASEWGIPATLLFVSLVGWGFYKFVNQSLEIQEKGNDRNKVILRISLIASFFAALVHSMFSGIFNSSLSQLLLTLIGAWIIGEYFAYSSQDFFVARSKKSLLVVLIAFFLLGNSVYVSYKVFPEIPYLNERQSEFFKKYHDYTLYPRFWNQGMIYENEDYHNSD